MTKHEKCFLHLCFTK